MIVIEESRGEDKKKGSYILPTWEFGKPRSYQAPPQAPAPGNWETQVLPTTWEWGTLVCLPTTWLRRRRIEAVVAARKNPGSERIAPMMPLLGR
jgi:hypothetical protein